jgi:hypothetical protein
MNGHIFNRAYLSFPLQARHTMVHERVSPPAHWLTQLADVKQAGQASGTTAGELDDAVSAS